MRGIESAWLRLKFWLLPDPLRSDTVISDLSHLSDHERRDIGLPDPVRYMDWRALKDQK
ncbi:hypothetical protein VB618_15805 [Microvirga sp. CF3062]|uniref:hypothetical protein n=1 Tax=Microvirga sp. CF3062 TaxID=3110182 RepID=UPI002E7689C0|nr:hypothetical protein [Microvirga sp. CF3062]MEE1657671.1 hypothetical protein [Microvirga sp. CF3062]